MNQSPNSDPNINQQFDAAQMEHHHAKSRRWYHWALSIVGLTVILPLLTAAIVYAALALNAVSQISTQPFSLSNLAADSSGRTNVLLLGQGDPGHAGQDLTDTIMLLSYDSKTKRIAQISVPRDLRVKIAGVGENKINSANVYGGVSLAEQTVGETLGVPINYYVLTDFNGLQKLVDAVGGIDVNVKVELIDTEYPCADNQYAVCGLDIKPGVHHMDGALALEYVRCRKGTCGNDFGRSERQQEVLNLVRDKAVKWQSLLNPTKLMPIVNALSSSVHTDMSALQLLELALDWQGAQKNDPIRLVFHTGPGGYLMDAPDSSDLVPASGGFDQIQDRVRNIFTESTQSTDLPQ